MISVKQILERKSNSMDGEVICDSKESFVLVAKGFLLILGLSVLVSLGHMWFVKINRLAIRL